MRQLILFLGLLCIVAAGPAPGNENVHEVMTEEETMQVFRSNRHALPEYEVVPLHLPKEHKRSYDSPVPLQINAFGRNIMLWLNPIEGTLATQHTPVYLVRTASSQWEREHDFPEFQHVINPMARIGKLLEDVDRTATMMVTKSANGQNTITGNILSERWGVSPLPDRVNNNYYRRFQRSADSVDNLRINSTKNDGPHYHVVYKLPEQNLQGKYGMTPVPEEFRGNQFDRSEVNVPDVIYPQVLVIADYETYKLHGEDLDTFLTYMLLFWNGVDLKYRSLQNPKVRFSISGIFIAQDSKALSFISDNVPFDRPDVCYIDYALGQTSNFIKWVTEDSYDIAIVMSPYKMCQSGSNECGILGRAYIGGACGNRHSRSGIVHDLGTFDGVHTAAHEIAHLFGVQHDGTVNAKCPQYDGYIMAPNQIKTEHTADWSSCSLIEFDTFFRALAGSNPVCLFNKPRTTNPLPRVMPGRLITRDQQCEKVYGTRDCSFALEEKDICISLPCFAKGDNTICVTALAPLDGTQCGPGKICLHGKCLLQSEILW